MDMKMLTALLLLLAGCAETRPRLVPQTGPIRWDAESDETVQLLRDMIRIDTTKTETELCRRVQELLAKDGIESEVLESAPGRGNLIARLRGDGSKKPVLLMAHIDVVQVDRAQWKEDPFGGRIRDGLIHGRGAIDDKGMAAVITHVFRMLKRRAVKLRRDVILMLNADEESGGKFGAKWMIDHHPDKVNAEMVLNEGGRIAIRGGKISFFSVQTAEKSYNDVRLWIRGGSGHSSIPRKNNAIYTLAELLAKLRKFETPIRLTDTVQAHLRGIAQLPALHERKDLLLQAADGEKAAATVLADQEPRLNAFFRTTLVPTVIQGGIRVNVLPPDVDVNLNIRLLPGDNLYQLLRDLAKHMELGDFEIVEADKFDRWKKERGLDAAFVIDMKEAEAPESPLDSPLLDAIEKVAKKMAPGAAVVPSMSTGATDSRFFRERGVTAYGLMPLPVSESEEKTFHDHNERVRVSSVRFGVEYIWNVLKEIAE